MGMTMTEKILAQHAGRDAVQAGDLLVAPGGFGFELTTSPDRRR